MICDMANDIIKKHNFELAKNRIKFLALQVPPSISLKKFDTEGWFWGFTDHNVTGSEINDNLVKPLQDKLIKQNEHIKKLFDTADEVYKALDYLDKEYVSGIVGTAEAAALASDQALVASKKAEQASNQALDASSQALDATKKATIAQNDIKNTIAALQQTVTILKTFKEKVSQELEALSSIGERFTPIENKISDIEQTGKTFKTSISLIDSLQKYRTLLESYQHLGDIDAIWSDVEGHKKELASFHLQVDNFVEKTNQSTARINADIEALQKFRTLLESYQHLGDIDAIWSDVEGHKKELASFHLQVDNFVEKTNQSTARINADIEALQKFRTLLESYQHLGDIDAIWSDVETLKKEYFNLHQNLSSFIEATNSEQEKIKETIHQMEIENNLVRQQYDKRMKIAYWIGGCAVGLTIVNYVLQFIGIL